MNSDHLEFIQIIRVYERYLKVKRKETTLILYQIEFRIILLDNRLSIEMIETISHRSTMLCHIEESLVQDLLRLSEIYFVKDQDRQRRGCQFSVIYRQSPKMDPQIGWIFWSSSSFFSS